jgi:predicted  nucleic acid-binding Zn-ribbon protein
VDNVLQDKTDIEAQFRNALEKLQELADEQARLSSLVAEKEHSLVQSRREGDALRTSTEYLKQKISELEKAMSEKEPASATLADAEKEQLLRSAHEYQETFEHLKEEIIALNRTIAEKEREINRFVSERDTLSKKISDQQANLALSQNAITDLNLRLKNTYEAVQHSEEEKQELHKAVAELKIGMENLREAKEVRIAEMKKDLSSYAEALADLRSSLEQSISENASLQAKQQVTQDTSSPLIRKKAETLPARISYSRDTKTRAGKRPLTHALLAILLVVLIGAAFYAHNTGLLVLPDRTAQQRAEPKKELSYQELFTLLNRSVTDGLKFQATLITEPLVLKSEEPEDRSLFDFQRYLYFKIHVSSPKDGFDKQIADDPYSRILLSAGTTDAKPLPEKKVKEIKTFYRKELPVSTIFYCAFPRDTIGSDSTVLRLSLKKDAAPSTLVWDLRQLREDNLVP